MYRLVAIELIAVLMCASLGFAQTQSITTDRIRSASNLTINPSGDMITDPVGNDMLPYVGYDINIGMLSKKYLALYASELWVETLVAQETIATIGGRILVGPTTTLTKDVGSSDTYICVKHNEMTNGDVAYTEGPDRLTLSPGVEFFSITSTYSFNHADCNATVDDYKYSVTRNLDGTGANSWTAGDAVFNTGQATDGFMDLYSLQTIKGTTANGVTNPGAESDLSGNWTCVTNGTASCGRNTTAPLAGTYNFYLTANKFSPNWARLDSSCVTNVVTGQEYFWQVAARGSEALSAGFYLRVLYYSDAACSTPVSYWDFVTNVGVGASYSLYQYYIAPPQNTKSVAYQIFNYMPPCSGSSCSIYFDEVAVTHQVGAGPTIVGNIRQSTVWNDWAPRWIVGNLNGQYNNSSTRYGLAAGNPSGVYIQADGTDGFRILDNTWSAGQTRTTPVVRGQWATDGSAYFGNASGSHVYIGTAGTLSLRNGSTEAISITNAGTITVKGWGNGSNLLWDTDFSGVPDNPSGDDLPYPPWAKAMSCTGVTQVAEVWDSTTDWSIPGMLSAYTTLSGTPASDCIHYIFADTVPVVEGQRYEAYAYLGNHRNNGGAYVQLSFYDAGGSGVGTFYGGSIPNTTVGGTTLASFGKSCAIGTAPTGATRARIFVIGQWQTGPGAAPYLFFVLPYLGPAGATQNTCGDYSANTIIHGNSIRTGTITADRITVNSLQALSANMGTLTSGSITGGTIDGATIRGGTGDEVTIDSGGISIAAGSNPANAYKFDAGAVGMYKASAGNIVLRGDTNLNWDYSVLWAGTTGTTTPALGTGSFPWEQLYLVPGNTDANDWPLVYSSGNKLVYYKDDGKDGTFTCSSGWIYQITFERGIEVGDPQCSSPPELVTFRSEIDQLKQELIELKIALGWGIR